MEISDPQQFVDLVAQAVIDKIEERNRIQSLVDKIVSRVQEMQEEERELLSIASALNAPGDADNGDS